VKVKIYMSTQLYFVFFSAFIMHHPIFLKKIVNLFLKICSVWGRGALAPMRLPVYNTGLTGWGAPKQPGTPEGSLQKRRHLLLKVKNYASNKAKKNKRAAQEQENGS
jgi:hypothetical protein